MSKHCQSEFNETYIHDLTWDQAVSTSEVVDKLREMIYDRASRGNCQSKHGYQAAIRYEIYFVFDRLNDLLGPTP